MALPQPHMNPNDNDGSNQPPLSAITNTKKVDAKIKILVIQQKMIGDVLASTIICESLRKKYPKAQIDYVIKESTKPVVLGNPYIDNIIEFKTEYKGSKSAFFKFLKNIRNSAYDIVIDAYGKLESNLITIFSGASEKVSYQKWYTSFLYDNTITPAKEPYTSAGVALENRLRLVYPEYLIESKVIPPQIYLSKEEKNNATNFLKSQGVNLSKPLVMIGVLGSEEIKTLPFAYMARVIDEIVNTLDATILFNYIPNQVSDARKIYDLTSEKSKENILFDVYAKSLRDFLGILSQCDVLVGNEGGAVNMAKALDKSTFTFFSPWIVKSAWNMFEDGKTRDSVHLKDFKPELFKNKTTKEIKKEAFDLYQQFTPDLYLERLREFLLQFKTQGS